MNRYFMYMKKYEIGETDFYGLNFGARSAC